MTDGERIAQVRIDVDQLKAGLRELEAWKRLIPADLLRHGERMAALHVEVDELKGES